MYKSTKAMYKMYVNFLYSFYKSRNEFTLITSYPVILSSLFIVESLSRDGRTRYFWVLNLTCMDWSWPE